MTKLIDVDLHIEKIDNGFIATGHIESHNVVAGQSTDEPIKRHFTGTQDLMNRITGELSSVVEQISRNEKWADHPNLVLRVYVGDK